MDKNRTLPLSALQDGIFISDSQEIYEICKSVGVDWEDITGAVVYLDESGADYKMIYLSESNAPYSLNALYAPLPYFSELKYNENLPVYHKWFIYF